MNISDAALDTILSAQLAVAWAGEGGDEPRLAWWRTELVSEFGGEDLFRRLTPATWRWVVLQAAREAARRCDAERRGRHHNPDSLISLFRLGFELDERLDERLRDLKRAGAPPRAALPLLGELMPEDPDDEWDREAFAAWLGSHGAASQQVMPGGIYLKGEPPAAPEQQIAGILSALAAMPDSYPLPHYRMRA